MGRSTPRPQPRRPDTRTPAAPSREAAASNKQQATSNKQRLARRERTLVEVTTTESGRLGNLGRRLLESNTLRNEGEHLGDAIRKARRSGLGPRNYQADLTTSAIGEVRRNLGRRATLDLLMEFREFATNRNTPIAAKSGNEIHERGRQPIRRLEEHHRPRLTSKRGEVGNPPLSRKETLKSKPIGGKATECKSSKNRTRSRKNGHNNASHGRSRNQRKTGIADCGHPGIGENKHILLSGELDDFACARILVVFVKRNESRTIRDSESTKKVNRGPGIFRCNNPDRTERIDKATRNIAEIPNRSRSEDDHGLFSQSLTDDAGSLG
jgi:hypothetical protein